MNLGRQLIVACVVATISGALCGGERAGADNVQHVVCAPLTPAGLDKLAQGTKGEVELIFFASWCSSCREHLTAKHAADSILIGVFDRRERLEETVAALGLTTPCYSDDGIAEALGVKALPRLIRYAASHRAVNLKH